MNAATIETTEITNGSAGNGANPMPFFSPGETTVMPSGVKVTSFLPNMRRDAPTRFLTERKRVAAYARV